MKYNIRINIDKSEGERDVKAVKTPLSTDNALMLIHLVSEDDELISIVSDKAKPAYFMMVINKMLDGLCERDREFMFKECENLRRDYVFFKEEVNES